MVTHVSKSNLSELESNIKDGPNPKRNYIQEALKLEWLVLNFMSYLLYNICCFDF